MPLTMLEFSDCLFEAEPDRRWQAVAMRHLTHRVRPYPFIVICTRSWWLPYYSGVLSGEHLASARVCVVTGALD